MFDPVDRIEEPREAPRGDHPFRIGGGAVGVDDAPPGQGSDPHRKVRIRQQGREVDVMHRLEVGAGIHVVIAHQTRQRRAMVAPVAGSQGVGLVPGDVKRGHDPVGHPDLDLIEQPGRGRVERVVQVEDPGGHMRKSGGDIGICHGQSLRGARQWAQVPQPRSATRVPRCAG